MWTRKQIKERAKERFKINYWKSVIVALILSVVVGGASGGFSGGTSGFNAFSNSRRDSISETKDEDAGTEDIEIDDDSDESFNENLDEIDGGDMFDDLDTPESSDDLNEAVEDINDTADELEKHFDISSDSGNAGALVAFMIVLTIICIIVTAIAILFDIFIINPIELGCNRFFLRNLDEPAGISNVVFAFDNGFKNIVKTLFFRDLYIVLWTMLFIIPGIIKSYEYRMIPYLLADNPNMTKEQAFAESKRMMTGNKWKAFVLDLSFIGWEILSIFTCGILSIFYVNPYIFSTNAALYEALKGGNDTFDSNETVNPEVTE